MRIHHSAVLSATALALSIVTSHAGPCSLEIDRMQDRVDATIAATAAAGPSAREGTAATMHRQPTPNSIAAAEEGLGTATCCALNDRIRPVAGTTINGQRAFAFAISESVF
jgi:hypothetical protein